ncbi:DUF2079 domain-containing protein [Calothrix sp. 336/3]|uniref:DUF2079 domain-containing protein n=1 Tax=Calothrix sp. 336/3 TaxID=1337936 RepID=UPI0005500E5D|nr:DUF2079 domain-containing protein [Calothrix sp. 336/3]AKG23000.1 membrane protein [Calothrix sp. 336/3]
MTNKMPRLIPWMISISALVFFVTSVARHLLYKSTAFDLGIFDQAVYLISQGLNPISSYMGYHILGDHAAFIFYPIAALYKIYPSVYWLFALQAISLAGAALPLWYLCLQAGLVSKQAIAIVAAYLLYPVVLNVNLFDFHPEVMAVPAFFTAILWARAGKIWGFIASVIWILSCKAVLSLTVLAMGVWLLIFEKRRWCGAIAIALGISWFLISTQVIIPSFSGKEAAAVGRFAYLGNSVQEIAMNLILKPGAVWGKILSWENFGYLILLLSPVIWGISRVALPPLVAAIPCVAINILADYQPQKDLVHQYSLPALPFLMVALIASLAANRTWVKSPRIIIIWSVVTFLCLAKYTHFGGRYLQCLHTWQATNQAIAQIQTSGSVSTTAEIATHLSHRQIIQEVYPQSSPEQLQEFDYILLNTCRPDWLSRGGFATNLVKQLKNQPEFNLIYAQDEVYLFTSQRKQSQPKK